MNGMVHVICDSCGCVGIRIRPSTQSNASNLHPAYATLNREYHCSICGARLRVAGIKEYDRAIMLGGETGA